MFSKWPTHDCMGIRGCKNDKKHNVNLNFCFWILARSLVKILLCATAAFIWDGCSPKNASMMSCFAFDNKANAIDSIESASRNNYVHMILCLNAMRLQSGSLWKVPSHRFGSNFSASHQTNTVTFRDTIAVQLFLVQDSSIITDPHSRYPPNRSKVGVGGVETIFPPEQTTKWHTIRCFCFSLTGTHPFE